MEGNHNKIRSALALERLPAVMARTGRSRTSIWRGVREGTFPRPVKIGLRSVAWPAHSIDTWIEAQIAAADFKEAA